MVVVHRAHGFRFVIYKFDHEPAHVHVYGDGEAKIQFVGEDGLPEVIYSIGMKRPDKRRALLEVEERLAFFIRKWEHIHDSTR
jgi:Domain of unknown function (DUF4160)